VLRPRADLARLLVRLTFHVVDFLNAFGKIRGKDDSFGMPALVTFRLRCSRIDQMAFVLLDIVVLHLILGLVSQR